MASPPHGFEMFEHTADIGVRAWGENLAQLFEASARGLFNVVVERGTFSAREMRKIELAAESREELLFAWLRELLYLFDTEHLVFSDFKFRDLTDRKLSCDLTGEKLDPKKHPLGHEVKAVTRHQFKLEQKDNQFFTEFILDI